jgi:hypothetical protein
VTFAQRRRALAHQARSLHVSLPDTPTVLFLGCLLAFHAASYALPGRAYFYLTSLSDATAPVGVNAVFHPALLLSAGYLMIRCVGSHRSAPVRRLHVITVGLAIWVMAATLSAIANADTDLVPLTLLSVFVAGALVYAAASRVPISERLVDVVFISLVIGALFPLLSGIREFVTEWGIPNLTIILNATLDIARMQGYEAATFGNRGNTAAFLMILGPPLLWLALDRHRPALMRAFYAICLVPVLANIAIIEVRAAFITSVLVGALVWRFRSGSRLAYVVFFCFVGIALMGLLQRLPEIDEMVTGRLAPVLLFDTSSDSSLQGRSEAIQEGIEIARRNWALGIGPGGALTVHSQTSAHQFYVQQAMETGVLGLLGCLMTTVGVLVVMLRTLRIGPGDAANRICFAFIIGPAGYVIYGVLANLTLSVGYVNAWAVIVSCLLALATSAYAMTAPAPRRAFGFLGAPRRQPVSDRLGLAGVSAPGVQS